MNARAPAAAPLLPSTPVNAPPLCVDLDGTLVSTDLLYESMLALLRQNLLYALLLPVWWMSGKARLKDEIARRVTLDASTLPYREEVVAWLQQERESGRRLVLATASNHRLAQAVADHLGLFDEVLASSAKVNLIRGNKRDELLRRYGTYDYIGDSMQDILVWASAREAIVVGRSASIDRHLGERAATVRRFEAERPSAKTWLKALRLHQWVKNVLVFVPLLTAHRLGDGLLLAEAFGAFVAFGLCASAVYVANDLYDLDNDRRHRTKRARPFAAGKLPILRGLQAIPLLLVASFALATWLSPSFALVLATYFVVTNAYTFWLKREALVDVLCLATLYTLRIFAGATSTGVPVSQWLLAFSMFVFLSLALVKRVSELKGAQPETGGRLHGRGYEAGDLSLASQLGVTSGHLSVLVFALYIQGDTTRQLYRHPELLWLVCPLIFFWLSRVWLLTHRGQMHDDPVVFALRDRTSYLVGAVAAGLLLWAR